MWGSVGQGAPQRVRDRDNMQAAVSEELYLVRRGRGGEAKSGKEEDREIGGGAHLVGVERSGEEFSIKVGFKLR